MIMKGGEEHKFFSLSDDREEGPFFNRAKEEVPFYEAIIKAYTKLYPSQAVPHRSETELTLRNIF